jgi:hypothetical protein
MAYTDSADDDPYAALPPDPGTEPVDPTAAEQDPEFMAQLARRYRNPAAGMGVQPDAPVSAESDILPLAAGAAGTLLSHIGQGYASMGRGIGNAVSGAYGSLKEALAAYANGDNAAPPAVVDAALQKTADALPPGTDKSQVVQAAIAGTANPLSPDYMDQAGRDVFGGAGGSTTIGQAPARTGYDQTQTAPTIASTAAPTALAQAVNPPLSRQDLIERGFDAEQADRIINAGDPNDPLTKGLSRFLPDGFLDDPNNRKNLQDMLSTQQGKRVYQEYVTPEGFSAGRLSGLSKVIGYSNPYINATDRGTLEGLAHQLIDQANSGNAPATSDLQQKVSTGYNPSNMQQALRMRAAGTLPSDIQRQQDMRNLTYDPTGAQEAPEPPMRSSGDGGGSTSRNTNRNTKTRAPAARGRRSDLDTGTEAPVQTAMADSGTMSDASNDIRSTVPAGAQVAAAGQTGYANQPPAPGGFSGAAGPATDVAVRPGAFTPAGAAVPAAPAAPAELPNGMKLVPTSGGQYDRAIVGSDGRVLQYIPKGQPSPSPQQAADIMSQSNTAARRPDRDRGSAGARVRAAGGRSQQAAAAGTSRHSRVHGGYPGRASQANSRRLCGSSRGQRRSGAGPIGESSTNQRSQRAEDVHQRSLQNSRNAQDQPTEICRCRPEDLQHRRANLNQEHIHQGERREHTDASRAGAQG